MSKKKQLEAPKRVFLQMREAVIKKDLYWASWYQKRLTHSDAEYTNTQQLKDRLNQIIDINTVFENEISKARIEVANQLLTFIEEQDK